MNRVAPTLLALGLASLLSQLQGDFVPDPAEAGEYSAATMLILAAGLFATLLGSVNLYRRWSRN